MAVCGGYEYPATAVIEVAYNFAVCIDDIGCAEEWHAQCTFWKAAADFG